MTANMGYVRYGIGAVCLFIAVFTAMMSIPAVVLTVAQAEAGPGMTMMLLGIAAFFALLGGYVWVRAVRLAPGDELLEGQRGFLIGLMLGTVLLMIAFAVYFLFQVDFWRGALEGMRDGSAR